MKFYERVNLDKSQISRDHVEQQCIEQFTKSGLDKISSGPLTFSSWFSKPALSIYSYEHGYEAQVTIQPNGMWLILTLSAWIYFATLCVRIFMGGDPSTIETLTTMVLAFAGPFLLFWIDRMRIARLLTQMFGTLPKTYATQPPLKPKSESKINEDLEKLVEFNKQGVLSAEEFRKAKEKLLSA